MAMVFQRCDSEGDAAARVVGVTQLLATLNDTRPQHRTAARARCVVGIQDGGGGGVSASTLSGGDTGWRGGVCVSINAF